jgi:MFS family permease
VLAPTAAAGPVRPAQPWLVLAICCMSLLIVGMDVTIVNVALPSIRRDLGASVSSLQWTTAGYTMALASLLMLGGSTADRLGRARVFKFGLALFTAASLACSLAPRIGWLIAFRVVQGIVALGLAASTAAAQASAERTAARLD